MEPKDLVLASLKKYKFIRNLKVDDIFKPVENALRAYISDAYDTILAGGIPLPLHAYIKTTYAELLRLYGVEALHAHAPDISYLGLRWYIEQGDLVIGTNFKEEEV